MADNAISMKQVIDAPMDQKAAAFKRLASNIGHLSFPGQLFIKDLYDAGQYDNPRDQFMRLMMGRASDADHYSMRFMYSGDSDPGALTLQDPSIASTLRDPYRERLGITYEGQTIPVLDMLTGGGVPHHSIGGNYPKGKRGGGGSDLHVSSSGFGGNMQGNMP